MKLLKYFDFQTVLRSKKRGHMNSSMFFRNKFAKSLILIFALTALTVTVIHSQGQKKKEKKEDQEMPIFNTSKSGLPIRDSIKKKKEDKKENPPAKETPSVKENPPAKEPQAEK